MLQRMIGKTMYEVSGSGVVAYLQKHSLCLYKATFQGSTYISIGIKFMLFVLVLIKLVPVACAALCASPDYVLVNSLQGQQCCP